MSVMTGAVTLIIQPFTSQSNPSQWLCGEEIVLLSPWTQVRSQPHRPFF